MKNKFSMATIVVALSVACPVLAQEAGQPATVDQSQQNTTTTDQRGGARARNSDYVNRQTTGSVVGDQSQGSQATGQTGGARAHNQDYNNAGNGTAINSGTGTVTDNNPNNNNVAVNDNNWAGAGKLERAEKVKGREVLDDQGERIGHVKDFVVDLKNGRIAVALIGSGGVLGVDEKLYAVPPQALTCNEADRSLKLNMTRDKFTSAPSFKKSDWEANVSQDKIQEDCQYYGQQPYWVANEQGNKARQIQMGQLVLASKFIGSSIDNMQNQHLGSVHDLIIDLPQARVAEVIVATGGFLGVNDEFSAIPPQAFRQEQGRDLVQLDTTKEVLANAPHFKSTDWPNFDQQQVTAVYRTYDVQPYWQEGTTATAVNNVPNEEINAMSQGTSKNDMAITRKIRQDIMAEKDLSINARNITVITLHGRVTLKGTVDTEQEKQKLGDIAAHDATAGSVDNELQVSSTTSSLQ